ncbi:uncharacterized protein LOC117891653 isoform X1 [Drosophila subobscura]|uniref:uncharacterized protein LOC117891653 isoform X1 n=1 Tax=Drosophila subobscura TaxID=7241 RepID=UPI00155A6955|nr:uncharacterized protein LOC117891653 isoform X1 [Drosophila subobscura]
MSSWPPWPQKVSYLTELIITQFKTFFTDDYVSRIEQAVGICHCIGCVFLTGGALLPTEIIRAADLLPHYQPHQLCHTDSLCHLHSHQLGARGSLHSAFCFGVHGYWHLLLAHCLLLLQKRDQRYCNS